MKFDKGIVIKWNEDKGYGFIRRNSNNQEIFFHVSDYSNNHEIPVNGLAVEFIKSNDNNRICAIKVIPLKGHEKVTLAQKQLKFSLMLSAIFFACLGGLIFLRYLPMLFMYVYLGMSTLVFLLYAKDKNAAQKGKWRTPENTLHLFSLMGGWPGAIIAQNKLRHKSKKISFRLVYWLTVILNCSALIWLLLSTEGNAILEVFNSLKIDYFGAR